MLLTFTLALMESLENEGSGATVLTPDRFGAFAWTSFLVGGTGIIWFDDNGERWNEVRLTPVGVRIRVWVRVRVRVRAGARVRVRVGPQRRGCFHRRDR